MEPLKKKLADMPRKKVALLGILIIFLFLMLVDHGCKSSMAGGTSSSGSIFTSKEEKAKVAEEKARAEAEEKARAKAEAERKELAVEGDGNTLIFSADATGKYETNIEVPDKKNVNRIILSNISGGQSTVGDVSAFSHVTAVFDKRNRRDICIDLGSDTDTKGSSDIHDYVYHDFIKISYGEQVIKYPIGDRQGALNGHTVNAPGVVSIRKTEDGLLIEYIINNKTVNKIESHDKEISLEGKFYGIMIVEHIDFYR